MKHVLALNLCSGMTTHASIRPIHSPRTSVSNEIHISVSAHFYTQNPFTKCTEHLFALCMGSVHDHIYIYRDLWMSPKDENKMSDESDTQTRNIMIIDGIGSLFAGALNYIHPHGAHEVSRVCPHRFSTICIRVLQATSHNNILCDRKRKATFVNGMLFSIHFCLFKRQYQCVIELMWRTKGTNLKPTANGHTAPYNTIFVHGMYAEQRT